MMTTTLGRTGLTVPKDGFGALPVQRADWAAAERILRGALDGGITYFDTARAYSDSETKIGRFLSPRRSEFVLATKTTATTVAGFRADLDTSLKNLRTDHIDIYQFHMAKTVYRPGDGTGLYEAMQAAQAAGKVRYIGITTHQRTVAEDAVRSGLYATLQYPLCYLSTPEECALPKLCTDAGVGFIAMKALAGGLITNVHAAHAWLNQYPNVVPIWGIQRETELNALFDAIRHEGGPTADHELVIEKDRKELAGTFCRGCGYCLPCPANIPINIAARMSLFLRRAPEAQHVTPEWQAEMAKIEECQHCGHCTEHCPYGLDTPALLAENLADYRRILAQRAATERALRSN